MSRHNHLHAFAIEVERLDGSTHTDVLNAHSSGEALHLWAEVENRHGGDWEEQVASIRIEELPGGMVS